MPDKPKNFPKPRPLSHCEKHWQSVPFKNPSVSHRAMVSSGTPNVVVSLFFPMDPLPFLATPGKSWFVDHGTFD